MKCFSGRFTAIFMVLSILSLIGFVSGISAQTKKKTPTKKTTTKPKPSVPTVITQADQYSNQNQQIITGNTENTVQNETPTQTPTQAETLDQKLDKISRGLGDLNKRISTMETNKKNDYDEKQKRLSLNLEILTKAEQRVETLRKQLFDMVEKENTVKTRLEQISYDMRPEMIDRQVAFAGTLRPEELREMRKKNLEIERANLQSLLIEIQATRTNLELNVQRADQLVEKLRVKLEKEIDEALSEDPKQ